MRPTGIGWRSPGQRTPGFVEITTTESCKHLFTTPASKQRYVRRFAEIGNGFGVADRFLYEKLNKKLKACDDNLSPANYQHHVAFNRLNEAPCSALIKTLDIPKEELKHYRYIGDNLMYDPVVLTKPQQAFMQCGHSLIKGTGGILVHPSLRSSTSASTQRKNLHGRNMSFFGSESFSTKRERVAPFHGSERMSRDEMGNPTQNFNSAQVDEGESLRNLHQFKNIRAQTGGYRRNINRYNRQVQPANNMMLNCSTKSGDINALESSEMNPTVQSAFKNVQKIRKLETGSSEHDMSPTQWEFSAKRSPPKSSPGKRPQLGQQHQMRRGGQPGYETQPIKPQNLTASKFVAQTKNTQQPAASTEVLTGLQVDKTAEINGSKSTINTHKKSHRSTASKGSYAASNASRNSRASRKTNTMDMVVIGGGADLADDIALNMKTKKTQPVKVQDNLNFYEKNETEQAILPEVVPSMILAQSQSQ